MTVSPIDSVKLEKLAEVAIKVGLQLQKDQDLVITAPLAALPLVRFLTKHAYMAGGGLVTTFYSDEETTLARYRHASDHVLQQLQGCQALMIEANHDPDLLQASRYPLFLKRRVGGPYGHLANVATAGILQAVRHPGLRCVVAAHLSAQNNAPLLAQRALAPALDWAEEEITVASPTTGTAWIAVAS